MNFRFNWTAQVSTLLQLLKCFMKKYLKRKQEKDTHRSPSVALAFNYSRVLCCIRKRMVSLSLQKGEQSSEGRPCHCPKRKPGKPHRIAEARHARVRLAAQRFPGGRRRHIHQEQLGKRRVVRIHRHNCKPAHIIVQGALTLPFNRTHWSISASGRCCRKVGQ